MTLNIDCQTGVILDLDDTLYNEFDFLKSAFMEIAKELDTKNWIILYSSMISMHRSNKNVFEYLSSNYSIEINKLKDIYRNHKPFIQPFNGVLDFFKSVKDNNGYLGIISDGRTVTQSNKINALGIRGFLDCIVISEDVGYEKPSEINFKIVEEKLKVKSYWYIADNFSKDFVTPKKLGWKTIALIDNGINIHPNSYKYINEMFVPDKLILAFSDLKVRAKSN